MMHATFPLGRIAGIRVGAHWSVLITMVLLTDLLAANVVPRSVPGLSPVVYWATGTGCAFAFLASLLAHELSHAFTARHHGLKAERITLWLLGGAAELPQEPQTPRAAFLIAAAGPAASLLLGGLFVGAAALGAPVLPTVAVAALTWLGWTNGVLALFNLLPGTPLDGGRVLEAIAWRITGDRRRARRLAGRAGQVLASALAAVGAWLFLTQGGFEGLWLVGIGWFLAFAARTELTAAPLRELLSCVKLGDLMSPEPVTAPGWYTVHGFLPQATQARHRTFPVVSFDGVPVGVISLARLSRVPETARTSTRLEDICAKPPACLVGEADTRLTDVLGRAPLRPGEDLVLVVDHGTLAGIVAPGDIARAFELATLGARARRPASP